MAVAVVGELVVGGRKLLEALIGYGIEVAAELGVLRQHHRRRSARHQRVNQRLPAVLPHFQRPNSICSANLGFFTSSSQPYKFLS